MHCAGLSSARWVTVTLLAATLPVPAATAAPAAPDAAPPAAPAGSPAKPGERPVPAPPAPPPATATAQHATPNAQAPATAPTPPGDVMPADRTITLEEALGIAYRNHANVLVAQESLEAARQRVTQAKSGTRPSIQGSVSFTESGSTDFGGVFGPQEPGSRNPNTSDPQALPQASARMTLYDQGQTRLAVRQAHASVRGASAGVENAFVTLCFLVTNDYFNLLRAEKLLSVNEEQVRLAQQQLDLVDARIAAGAAARSDRAPIETQFALARERLISSQNSVRQQGSALRNSMGLPSGPPPQIADAPPPEFVVPALDESLAEAFRRRPDLREDQESMQIADANVQLARIRRLPVLTTTAGVNITPAERRQRGSWSIFTGLSMPIWDAGVTRSRQEEASANLGAASARFEQTRKNVAADVEQAVYNVSSARERVDASQASVRAATVALQAANARFEVGLAIPIEITTAQLDYVTAQNSAIQALYDYFIARAQLDRAIGRYRGASGG